MTTRIDGPSQVLPVSGNGPKVQSGRTPATGAPPQQGDKITLSPEALAQAKKGAGGHAGAGKTSAASQPVAAAPAASGGTASTADTMVSITPDQAKALGLSPGTTTAPASESDNNPRVHGRARLVVRSSLAPRC